MRLSLEHITFNYEKDLAQTGAFHLRRNETQIVPIPEWRKEYCSSPECAPAGYVIAELPSVLSVQASFVCDDPSVSRIEVRAVEEPSAGVGVLGYVCARPVELSGGRSDSVTFTLPLARSRIKAAGVAVSAITWKWQFSPDATVWTDFQTTQHRIYTVLEMPTSPWEPRSDDESNIHVPWTEVLDYACAWAAGAKQGLDEAATRVTHRVYRLGKENLVSWDGTASYARIRFDCTSFLQLLRGEGHNDHKLNCEDCATIVSTFANVLGCDLSQSRMGLGFITKPILLIGATKWEDKRFAKHEVAWEGDCGDHDPLFDACLQVDGDPNPSRLRPLQPTNLVFSSRDSRSYKSLLVCKGNCNPEQNKQRRKFGVGPLREHRITDQAFLDFLKEHYSFNTWRDVSLSNYKAHSPLSSVDLQTSGDAFQGWHEEKVQRFEAEGSPRITETLLRTDLLPQQQLVRVTIYEGIVPESASEFLLELLGQFQPLDFERLTEPLVGDVAFVSPDATTVLFKAGTLVSIIRSVGTQPTHVVLMAAAINDSLVNPHT